MLTDQLGIGYSPVVLPGSSDRNRNGGTGPFGNRYSGSFYEAQLKNVLKIKPKFVFGAMFDEFPECEIFILFYSSLPFVLGCVSIRFSDVLT